MGIKGIYGEIGTGRRVSLAKLAAEHIATHGRPLKIAIDISIWLFQVQASSGGASPAIRTLYFRLVRFLSHGICPLFVFDGPDKPPFKRGAPTSSAEASLTRPAKRLIGLFGFQLHTAPGEAEAECANLQKAGIVDMVLSEDVDTLAFGCTATIRNWTPEGSRGSRAPTHVNMFTAQEIRCGPAGLDQAGMILVAMMNGGDYLPAGIPGCGMKLACEAARAGFGGDLCDISSYDAEGLNAWRDRLRYELLTNESGFFRTKHKALKIPDDFPDLTVLGYHAHPLVSLPENLLELQNQLAKEHEIDVKGLRDFVDEQFEWRYLSGAKKFLRQLAPSLLAHRLRQQAPLHEETMSIDEQTEREEHLVTSISSRRTHFSTDGISEIKVIYIPACVVGLDLDQEATSEEADNGGCSEDDEEVEAERGDSEDEIYERDRSPVKRSRIATWDPWAPANAWIPEAFVRIGAPLSLERWDALMHSGQVIKAKNRTNGATAGGMKNGALNSYLRVTKQNPLTISQQQDLMRKALGADHDQVLGCNRQTEQAPQQSIHGKQRHFQIPGSSGKTSRKQPARKSVKGQPSKKSQPTALPQNITPWTLAQQRPPAAIAPNTGPADASIAAPFTPSMGKMHLNTFIRKSVEGTWKINNEIIDEDFTPERLVPDVSLVDMTGDS